MVILDTCALIGFTGPSVTISNQALFAIKESACILSVSLAEIACKLKLNKLNVDYSAPELHDLLLQIPSITIINIGVKEWFDAINLDWPHHRDPVDRLIVAFAQKNDIPIVTSDKSIKKFYKHVIW